MSQSRLRKFFYVFHRFLVLELCKTMFFEVFAFKKRRQKLFRIEINVFIDISSSTPKNTGLENVFQTKQITSSVSCLIK